MLLQSSPVEIGWQAEPFVLADAGGRSYDFEDLRGDNGLLVAFICNHCPYVIAIIDRFVGDAKKLQEQGIGVVAINSNDYQSYAADSPPNMKKFAEQHGFTFPYLIDEDQLTARAYDAVCTPDFFGFNSKGRLAYRGRLDDARMGEAGNRIPELVNAMQRIAVSGEGPDEQLASMGCSIKWRQDASLVERRE